MFPDFFIYCLGEVEVAVTEIYVFDGEMCVCVGSFRGDCADRESSMFMVVYCHMLTGLEGQAGVSPNG